MMNEQIWKHRGPLRNTQQALDSGTVRLGFIGGSITDARTRHNWPEPVIAWFKERYPHVRLFIENAAIGATGSELAVFRAEHELIERECDLVFVDYSVNDEDEPSEKRMRTREGLLRKLLVDGRRDVVIVHTFRQSFYREMSEGGTPASVADFEDLAEHYGIGSVGMGMHALEEVRRGRMRWEEWLPDGLHPTERGSLSYARSVIAFLENELSESRHAVKPDEKFSLPTPLNPDNWEKASSLPLSELETEGPWVIRRWPHLEWMDQVLETSAIGAKLKFSFVGRGLSLGFDFGKTSSELRYRLDNGPWEISVRERPDWCGNDGWYRMYTVAEDLIYGTHEFEMEVIHGDRPDCKGTNCRLALVGIL
ncbi:SGNH/GDSL hydrolase family protein [Cohnella silvisoli]|uniref:SGNH/GDSL hydrolase family protein n=1 Tax=Cohnella silvisoli TaxID=2873699 RepID=A0ABV1L3G6_9BACL|nr:SGNH/GDSL hydrolase family protein [Cohnella silvisoli]MCD9026186.1 SGNH/GDSL hydrolase family protein [Cohnella silvisoli]